MTAILAILGSIGSAIGAVLKAIPPTVWLCIACVLVGLLLAWKGCGSGGCGCRRHVRPPKVHSYDVAEVLNGASIVVKIGLRDRRTATVTLAGIAAPMDGDLAEASRAHLELSAGDTIRVEPMSGLPAAEPMDLARRDVVGVVFGASGAALNVEQLAAGFAKLTADNPPKSWRDAQAYAQKHKLGIWGAKP